jgi:hypothetical protein
MESMAAAAPIMCMCHIETLRRMVTGTIGRTATLALVPSVLEYMADRVLVEKMSCVQLIFDCGEEWEKALALLRMKLLGMDG